MVGLSRALPVDPLYAEGTIAGCLRCARLLASRLDGQDIPGDLTPACEPQIFNQFLRWYLDALFV